MKIVVNSHARSDLARAHLLESMQENPDFLDFEVLVVIGGYYDNGGYVSRTEGNITYIECNHNTMDLTALIALVDLFKDSDDYYFYMHDTCKVGANFYKKLKAIDLKGVSSIRINKKFSMNIGIYSQTLLNTFADTIIPLKNHSDATILSAKQSVYAEDYIFFRDPTNTILDDYDGFIHEGPTNYYGTGTMRIVEYYPNMDMYKIKANWGMNGHDVLTN
jgi:hypothetical protein